MMGLGDQHQAALLRRRAVRGKSFSTASQGEGEGEKENYTQSVLLLLCVQKVSAIIARIRFVGVVGSRSRTLAN